MKKINNRVVVRVPPSDLFKYGPNIGPLKKIFRHYIQKILLKC